MSVESRTPQTVNQEADGDGTIDTATGPSTSSEHQKLHEVDDDDDGDEEDDEINVNTVAKTSSNRNDQSSTNNNSNTSRKNMMMSNESNADAMVTMGTAPSRGGVGNPQIGLNGGGGGMNYSFTIKTIYPRLHRESV